MSFEEDVQFQEAVRLRTEGDYESALVILVSLADARPDSAALFVMLGDVHSHLGNVENALQSFANATTLSSRSEIASLGLFHFLWDQNKHTEAICEMNRFLEIGDSADYQRIREELRSKGL